MEGLAWEDTVPKRLQVAWCTGGLVRGLPPICRSPPGSHPSTQLQNDLSLSTTMGGIRLNVLVWPRGTSTSCTEPFLLSHSVLGT